MGGVLGSFILSLLNLKLIFPPVFRPIVVSLIGLSMGSLVTLETLTEVTLNFPLFIGLLIFIPLYIAFSTYAHHKIMRIPLGDSFLCSMPGLLSYVVIIAEEKKCDFALIMLVHGFRLIFLVIIIPLWLVGRIPPVAPLAAEFSFDMLNFTIIAGLIGVILWMGKYLSQLKITAPWLLAAVILSAVISLIFNFKVSPDAISMTLAQLFLGSMVGGNIKRESLKRPLSFYLKMIFVFGLCLLFVILTSALLLNFTTVSFSTVLLSFSPGGLEAMVLIAITLNLNPLLVSALHIMRMIYLGFLMPFMDRFS